jgi:hypothetical protein
MAKVESRHRFAPRLAARLAAVLLPALLSAGTATATISWSAKAQVPTWLVFPAVAAVDGKIYAIGGENTGGMVFLNDCRAYDPSSDIWTSLAPMPTARALATVAVVGCRIFVIGGMNSGSAFLDTVEVYDTRRNEWRTMDRAPYPFRAAAGATLSNRVFMAGGRDPWYWNTSTFIYSPYQDSWDYAAGPAYYRDYPAGTGVAGCFHLVGGQETNLSYSNRNEAFNPVSQTWSLRQILAVRPIANAAAEVAGKMYNLGGLIFSGSTTYVASYDPATNIWTPEDRLPGARWGHGAASVAGKLYVVGGVDPTGLISTTLYEGVVAGIRPWRSAPPRFRSDDGSGWTSRLPTPDSAPSIACGRSPASPPAPS